VADAARDLRLASRQSQAGQGHHGVAPQSLNSDSRRLRFLVAASDDVLSAAEVRSWAKASATGVDAVTFKRRAISAWRVPPLSGIALFGGGNDRCQATSVQIQTQDQRIEEVFGESRPRSVGVVFEVPVPTAAFRTSLAL